MKLERLCAQRRKESAEARELPVGAGERPRQLCDLLHADAGARTGPARRSVRSRRSIRSPLPLERERVGVAVRQRVLDDGTRRLLRTARAHREATESRSGPRGGGHPQLFHYPPLGGPETWAAGPIFGGVSAHVSRPSLILLVLVSPAQGADSTLDGRLDRALAVPNVDPARTAALAVDLRTGAVVYSRNPALALVPASNQKLPVAYAALVPARARLPLPHRGRGQRHARRRRLARRPLAARVRRPDARAG